jgi:hypothetical protein
MSRESSAARARMREENCRDAYSKRTGQTHLWTTVRTGIRSCTEARDESPLWNAGTAYEL